MDDSSDDQDKLEYLNKNLLHPVATRSSLSWRPVASGEEKEIINDDDSNHLFMSEPSMSEADSSEHHMRILSPTDSYTEEGLDHMIPGEENILLIPPPPPPQAGRLASQHQQVGGATSPGNTSLSSWESPHFSRRIQLHFSPDRGERKDNMQSSSSPSILRIDTIRGKRLLTPVGTNTRENLPLTQGAPSQPRFASSLGGDASTDVAVNPDRGVESDHLRSSNSTSSASEGQRRHADDFLARLRVTSKGQVQESAIGTHASFESPFKRPQDQPSLDINDVLRPMPGRGQARHERTSSVDTALVQNTTPISVPVSSTGNQSATTNTPKADDTVVMTLSASEDEGTKDDTTTTDDVNRPLDWEQQHSADDEKTADRPRRIRGKPPPSHRRQRSGDVSGGHRRQRSGDAAAASLVTGSKDWKGMEQDKIPLPPVPGDHDDDDDEDDDVQRDGQSSTDHHDPFHNVLSSIEGSFVPYDRSNSKTVVAEAMDTAQFSHFALGSSGNSSSLNSRQSRRTRRDARSARLKRNALSDNDRAISEGARPSSPIGDFSDQSPASIVRVPINSFSPLRPSGRSLSQPGRIDYHNFNDKRGLLGLSPGSDVNPTHRPAPQVSRSDWNHNDIGIVGLSPESEVLSTVNSARPSNCKEPLHQIGTYNMQALAVASPGLSPRPEFITSVPEQWNYNGRPNNHKVSVRPNPEITSRGSKLSASSPRPDRLTKEHDQRVTNSCGTLQEPAFSVVSGQTLTREGASRGVLDSETTSLWQPSRQDHQAYHDSRDVQTCSEDSSSDSADSEASFRGRASFQRGDSALHHPLTVVRHHHTSLHHASPFANIGKSTEKADRRKFMPQTSAIGADERTYPTYICPRCKTRQREFFTVSNAPRQFESPAGYVAFYFVIYVIAALYIFGMQEGWPALDCIYFAVITLTTAGLGDLKPTSDGAKISCSIFIYFGVACIGLLLGSYIAGMLDESSSREAKENRIESCPNCARLRTIKDDFERKHHRAKAIFNSSREVRDNSRVGRRGSIFLSERSADSRSADSSDYAFEHRAKKSKHQHHSRQPSPRIAGRNTFLTPDGSQMPINNNAGLNIELSPSIGQSYQLDGAPPPAMNHQFGRGYSPESPISPQVLHQQPNLLGSPLTAQILGRQSHTRHASFDLTAGKFASMLSAIAPRARNFSADLPTTVEECSDPPEGEPAPPPPPPQWHSQTFEDDEYDTDTTDSDESSDSDLEKFEEQQSRVKNAKYVVLTLKEALVNSMVIIAFGCLGFFFIEGFSIVDSWYFTTVLLTTVGYGDIVPATKGGKLFATIYILVAGTILLNNMSLISMIPLELRKRRIERAVLTQFGDQLDDAALRELATGPLIQRLRLSGRRDGLDECTREMFALAMLVRLGKVTEQDIRSTFAAFKSLDVNDDGVLNSKSIIAGMIQKRRSGLIQNGLPPQPLQQPFSLRNSYSQYWGGGNNLHHVKDSDHSPDFDFTPEQQYHKSNVVGSPSERSSLVSAVPVYNSME